MISNERVVPKYDFALRRRNSRVLIRLPRKPSIEPLLRIMRQGSSCRKSEHLLHHRAQGPELQQGIGEGGHGASDPAQQIDIAQKSFAHGQTVASMTRMHELRFEQSQVHVGGAFRSTTFAGEAVAESCVQFLGAKWIMAAGSVLEGRANNIGAAAR